MALQQYDKLIQLNKEIMVLRSIEFLLMWDREALMPEGGIELRGEQNELLATLMHAKRTSSSLKKVLSELLTQKGTLKKSFEKRLNTQEVKNIKLIHQDYLKHTRLPTQFVKKLTSHCTKTSHTWIKARKENNFSLVRPYLKTMFELMKQKADYIGYASHPYDALVDESEPGMTTKELNTLFGSLKEQLLPIIQSAKNNYDTDFLSVECDHADQMKLCRSLIHEMGLPRDHTRLDISEHPFCVPLYPRDLRLTTSFRNPGFWQGISATLHEGGHGLYEHGLKVEHFGTPLAEATSLGIHESQSRLWETFIGQSKSFCQFIFPRVCDAFPEVMNSISLDHFYHAINHVKPSFIRIYSDEVTYCMHVILRFEIEKGIIEEKYSVDDLPDIWNSKLNSLLGITPDSDSQGCLQDIHWYTGLVGYFPTYALGNIYAGQLHQALQSDIANYDNLLADGNFDEVVQWLTTNIHQHGRHFSSKELIKKATKKNLTVAPYIEYLATKYL